MKKYLLAILVILFAIAPTSFLASGITNTLYSGTARASDSIYTDGAGEPEANVYGVIGNELFWGTNFQGTNIGHIYKTDLGTDVTTTLYTGSYSAHWQGVKIGDYFYMGGEEKTGRHFRAMLYRVGSAGVVAVSVPDTDDCNEIISVESDGTNIIGGERMTGGLNDSRYPFGSGIWRIPIATYDNPATWTRTYQDASGYEWNGIVYRDSIYYGLLRDPSTGKWKLQHSSDLVTWTVDLDHTVVAPASTFTPRMTKAGTHLVVIGVDESTDTWHEYVYNGVAWSDYETALAVDYNLGIVYWDSNRAKVVFDTTRQMYQINLNGTGLLEVNGDPYPAVTGIYSHVWYVQPRFYEFAYYPTLETLYIPVSYTTATDAKIYKTNLSVIDYSSNLIVGEGINITPYN